MEETPDEKIARLEKTLLVERERHFLDVQAHEKQRKYLLRALQCADSRSMVMRAESATRRELIRFQKLVLKLREHCRAVHAAYEAIANKHGETVVVSSFDELLASCVLRQDSPRPK